MACIVNGYAALDETIQRIRWQLALVRILCLTDALSLRADLKKRSRARSRAYLLPTVFAGSVRWEDGPSFTDACCEAVVTPYPLLPIRVHELSLKCRMF